MSKCGSPTSSTNALNQIQTLRFASLLSLLAAGLLYSVFVLRSQPSHSKRVL